MKRTLSVALCVVLLALSLLVPAAAVLGTTSANLLNSATLTPLATGFTPLDQLVSSIFASKLSSASSTYEKVKILYDYVNTGASYQAVEPASSIYSAINSECNYVKSADTYSVARAYNFLKTKIGTCLDFADAFLVLMRALGLECYLMRGTYDSGQHYWNLIKLGSGYYIFDTEADWAASGRNGTSTAYWGFCLAPSEDTHRSCNQSACIAEFGNFQCRNKTNNPGSSIPGSQTTMTSVYTTGTYRLDDRMNFRSDHNTTASIYSVLPTDTTVTVTEVYEEWGKITYNGKTGWISLEYSTKISETTGTKTSAEPTTKKSEDSTSANSGKATGTASYKAGVYLTEDEMNFRSNHNTSASVLALIPAGTQLTVTEVSGVWGKTTYNGKTGWLSLEYSAYQGAAAAATKTEQVVAGDADGNGKISAEDARLILRHSVALETIKSAYQSRADIDGDGRITSEDARIALRMAVHIE